MPLTLYSTTTCGPCKIVAKRLTDARIPFDHIHLDRNENILAELKTRLDTNTIHTPVVIDNGEVVMRGPGIDPAALLDLIAKHRRDNA